MAVRVEIFLIKNLSKNIYTFYLFSSKTPHLLHRVTMERQPSQQDSHRFHHERAARCPPLFFSAWVATRFLNPHQVMGEGSAPFRGDVGVVVWGWQGPPGVGRPVHGRAPKRHSWQRRGPQTAASGDVVLVDVGAVACGVHRAARSPPPFQVPSASRRGGLKTPGGGCRPSALGSGRSGPRGGVVGRSLPSPRRLRRPPRGRGGARRGAPRSLPPRPSGGGYPTAVVWAVAVCGGACARSPASPGEGGNPPGACGVCPSTPWRVGAGRPVV